MRRLALFLLLAPLLLMGQAPNIAGSGSGGSGGGVGANLSTTGAVATWDGTELVEGSATCVDAGGVLTCDGYVSRLSTAPQPYRVTGVTRGCLTNNTVKQAIPFGNAQDGCQNFETGGATTRVVGIPLNQDRALALRALTISLWPFGDPAGWEDSGTGEAIEFSLSVCTIDASPAYADCTDVDTFVIQNEATPTITHGAGSRAAKSCVSGGCTLTWTIDGAGRASSAGDPTWDAGAQQYIVVWFENDATNFNAEGGTSITNISASFTIDYEN